MKDVDPIQHELAKLEEKHGRLDPTTVVEFAKNPETALHARFTWDDTRAAEQWRLHQARNVIRARVTILETESGPVSVRAYPKVSGEQGYQTIERVMSRPDLMKQYLEDMKRDYLAFRRKYRDLEMLDKRTRARVQPLFDAGDRIFETKHDEARA